MSNEFLLHAESRSDMGKGASRRLRRLQSRVPGIIYGGSKEPAMVSLELRELNKALENEAFYSHILTLDVDGKKQQVVIRDLQRHPAKGTPMHADFLRVDKTHKITMQVPLHFINEETSIGVKKQGGKIIHNASEVEVSCLPQDLPEFIEVDMANVELEQILHLSDLKVPKGVEIVALTHGEEHDQPIVAIHAPKGGSDEEEDEAGADEAEGGEEKA